MVPPTIGIRVVIVITVAVVVVVVQVAITELGAVALRVSPIASTVVAQGTVIGSQNRTKHSAVLVTKCMTSVELLGFLVVLTELTIIPDDNALLPITRFVVGRRCRSCMGAGGVLLRWMMYRHLLRDHRRWCGRILHGKLVVGDSGWHASHIGNSGMRMMMPYGCWLRLRAIRHWNVHYSCRSCVRLSKRNVCRICVRRA